MAELSSKLYPRFTLTQRLEHWVMAITFSMLCLTGLPQSYPLTTWGDWLIGALGGIETVRIIHRVSAVGFMLVLLFHIIAVLYRVYVKRVRLTMLPTLKDATDLLDSVRYQLGLIREHPKLPRYTFAEKMEYWAVIWGGVIMVITGFMLWNPIATTRFFPGEFVPAAKAAHGAEALLAFLAIIIWHFYWVHIKDFNRSIFTGHLTRQQMEHEHAAELELIESGRIPPPPPPEVKLRRERIFTPVASILTAVGLVTLYGFVTFEQTAITTVPPAETVVAFIPATPTSTPTPSPTPIPTPTVAGQVVQEVASSGSVPLISHPIGGREDCLECHAADGPLPYPPNHEGWPVSTCTVCHSTDQENPPPPPVQHKIKGREDCLKCHELDTLPDTHQAGNFTSEDCQICHRPEEEAVAQNEAESTPDEESAANESETASSEESAANESEGTSSEESTASESEASAPVGDVTFANDILPLFEDQCETCHIKSAKGDLLLSSYESLMKGGASGPVVVPGSPNESLLVKIMQDDHPRQLEGEDLEKLIAWIAAGASAEEGTASESESVTPEEGTESESEGSASAGNITFAKDILPLFEKDCKTCHIKTAKGDLSLSSYEALMKGGANGPVVVPGSPNESSLVTTMQDDHPRQLEGQDLQKLIDWIAAGASAEEGAANEAKATPTKESGANEVKATPTPEDDE